MNGYDWAGELALWHRWAGRCRPIAQGVMGERHQQERRGQDATAVCGPIVQTGAVRSAWERPN